MSAFEQGKEHRRIGKSKFYNPFRHKGGSRDYNLWIKGWLSCL